MTTTTNQPAPQAAHKLPKLTVDNLRHIHDHGLAVQFSDPKLSALIARLASQDGKTELTAGQSKLTVTKLGNVVRTEAFWSVGSYDRRNLHYYDPAAGLRFTLKRSDGGSSHYAYETVNAVVFGGSMPRIWQTPSGERADELQDWLRNYSWALLGAAGMRAQALKSHGASLRSAVGSAENTLAYCEHQLAKLESQTPETFAKRHADLRETTRYYLERAETKAAELRADLEQAASADSASLATLAGGFGAWCSYRNYNEPGRFGWAGTEETVSPRRVAPNYTATVSESGQITLSSGIVCEFTYPQLVAWLRGEAPAPVTRYGTVRKLETCDNSNPPQPLTLLECGCHRIDAAKVNAELAALLTPTHQVRVVPATPGVYLEDGVDAFRAELVRRITAALEKQTAKRAETLLGHTRDKLALETEQSTLPAAIAAQQAKVESAKQDVAKAQAALDAYRPPLGCNAEQAEEIACKAISALVPAISIRSNH